MDAIEKVPYGTKPIEQMVFAIEPIQEADGGKNEFHWGRVFFRNLERRWNVVVPKNTPLDLIRKDAEKAMMQRFKLVDNEAFDIENVAIVWKNVP